MGSLRARQLILPGVTFVAFWAVAILGWRLSSYLQPLFLFGYIGTALGIGLGLYATLPKKKKQRGRKLRWCWWAACSSSTWGSSSPRTSRLSGCSSRAGGPGWGRADALPDRQDRRPAAVRPAMVRMGMLDPDGPRSAPVPAFALLGPRRRQLAPIRHFALSLGLVLMLWFAFGYRDQVTFGSAAGLKWMLAGNGRHDVAAVGMAYALRDNRAFCKYLCPVTVVLKTTSRLSLLKIEADRAKCTECEACVEMCPMDIQLLDYIRNGQRILNRMHAVHPASRCAPRMPSRYRSASTLVEKSASVTRQPGDAVPVMPGSRVRALPCYPSSRLRGRPDPSPYPVPAILPERDPARPLLSIGAFTRCAYSTVSQLLSS